MCLPFILLTKHEDGSAPLLSCSWLCLLSEAQLCCQLNGQFKGHNSLLPHTPPGACAQQLIFLTFKTCSQMSTFQINSKNSSSKSNPSHSVLVISKPAACPLLTWAGSRTVESTRDVAQQQSTYLANTGWVCLQMRKERCWTHSQVPSKYLLDKHTGQQRG